MILDGPETNNNNAIAMVTGPVPTKGTTADAPS